MSGKDANAITQLEKLENHWDTAAAAELLQNLQERLGAEISIVDSNLTTIHTLIRFRDIRLRGLEEIPALFIGPTPDVTEIVTQFYRKESGPGKVLLFLTLNQHQQESAESATHGQRCLVLGPAQLRALLSEPKSKDQLMRWFHRKIPIFSLIPYNYILAAQGNMFFGREAELNKLLHEDETSFAVAGPSRIGKTSLVRQYQRNLLRAGDRRYQSSFYVDLYECNGMSKNEIANFLAMKIDGTKRSVAVTEHDLMNLLKRLRSQIGQRVELVLDETDGACEAGFFSILAEAAKLGLCRLILCGRGKLLQLALSNASQLGHRLELLRVDPLDEAAAERLIIDPLSDLGLTLEDPGFVLEHLFRLTGRLPCLLQLFAKQLAELAIGSASASITAKHLDTVKWDFSVAQYITAPLNDLLGIESRLVALLLLKSGASKVTEAMIQSVGSREGMNITVQRSRDIANDLFINNILAWVSGSFRIANEAISYYARETGYLDGALAEARLAVHGKAVGKGVAT